MSKSNKSLNIKKMDKASLSAKISNMIEYGRKEITTKEELEEFPIGSLISYMNKNNIFKTGGFIIKFSDEYFIYIMPDFTTKYRVRYKNVLKMWAGDVYSVKNDIVSIVKSLNKKTNFPVKLDNIVIYYGKNNFDVKRFMNTDKYKNMIKWYEFFN